VSSKSKRRKCPELKDPYDGQHFVCTELCPFYGLNTEGTGYVPKMLRVRGGGEGGGLYCKDTGWVIILWMYTVGDYTLTVQILVLQAWVGGWLHYESTGWVTIIWRYKAGHNTSLVPIPCCKCLYFQIVVKLNFQNNFHRILNIFSIFPICVYCHVFLIIHFLNFEFEFNFCVGFVRLP